MPKLSLPKFVPKSPRQYKSKKGAQEAHEAIRPTSVLRRPDQVKGHLSPDQFRLYTLVWQRFVASQMEAAVMDVTSVDIAAAVRELKRGDGPDLLTQGSSKLLHQLLATDLVDELRLLVYPVLLGRGKRLFDDHTRASAFRLEKSMASSTGVLVTRHVRVGEVRTGSFGQPS